MSHFTMKTRQCFFRSSSSWAMTSVKLEFLRVIDWILTTEKSFSFFYERDEVREAWEREEITRGGWTMNAMWSAGTSRKNGRIYWILKWEKFSFFVFQYLREVEVPHVDIDFHLASAGTCWSSQVLGPRCGLIFSQFFSLFVFILFYIKTSRHEKWNPIYEIKGTLNTF